MEEKFYSNFTLEKVTKNKIYLPFVVSEGSTGNHGCCPAIRTGARLWAVLKP